MFIAVLGVLGPIAPARAAKCGGDFSAFLSETGREAQAAGISRAVIDQAFAGLTPDPAVLSTAASAAPSASLSRNTRRRASSPPVSTAPRN